MGAAAGWSAGWQLTPTFEAVVLAGAVGGFAAGFTGTMLNGGSIGDALQAGAKGAAWGAASAAAAYSIGHGLIGSWIAKFKEFADYATVLAHGISQGLLQDLQGGTFASGFYSAAFAHGVGLGMDKMKIGFDPGSIGDYTSMAIIGGTASALGGGTFANGAMTAAFVNMFNRTMRLAASGENIRQSPITDGSRLSSSPQDDMQIEVVGYDLDGAAGSLGVKHSFLLMTKKSTGEQFFVRAGPNADGSGTIHVLMGAYKGSFEETYTLRNGGFSFRETVANISETEYSNVFVRRLVPLAKGINTARIPYAPLGDNCNTFTFMAVEVLLDVKTNPVKLMPGSGHPETLKR